MILLRQKKKNDELIFTEQTHKDKDGKLIKMYLIGNKQVDEHTYMSLFDSEIYDKITPEVKPIQKPTENNNIHDTEYDAFKGIVEDIKELPTDEAIEYVENLIDNNVDVAYKQAQVEVYNALGNAYYKTAASMENELNDEINWLNSDDSNDDED